MLYRAYGLCIDSEIRLPLLQNITTSNLPKIRICIDDSLNLPKEYSNTSHFTKTNLNTVIYFKKKVGLFKIKEDLIKIKPDYKTLDADFVRVMLGLPFGYLLMLRSQLTFHASAVSKNNKGIIFMGESGLGKSTIAYDLILNDFKLITEDICTISKNKIINSFPLIKISDNKFTKNSNIFTEDKFNFLSDSMNRKGFILKDKYLADESAIHSAYIFLESDIDYVKIKSLSINQSIKYIFHNTFKTHPIRNDLLLKKNIKKVIDFALNTNIYAVLSSKNNFKSRNFRIFKHISERA